MKFSLKYIVVFLLFLPLLALIPTEDQHSKSFSLWQASDSTEVIELLTDAQKYIDKGLADKADTRVKQALELAKSINYKIGIIRSKEKMARVFSLKREFGKAIESYYEALTDLDKLDKDSRSDRYIIYTEMALLYNQQGITNKSLEYFLKSKDFLEKDNITDKMNLNRYIALAERQLKNHQEAIKYYSELLTDAKKQKNVSIEIAALRGLSDSYGDLKNHEESLKYNLEILEIKEKMGDKDGISSQYNHIGYNYRELKQYSRALYYYQESLKLNQQLGKAEMNKVGILRNIGVIYQLMGDTGSAISSFTEALKIAEKSGTVDEVAVCYNYIITNYIGQNDYRTAETFLNQSIDIFKKTYVTTKSKESQVALAKNYLWFAEISQKTGKYSKALEYTQQAAKIKEKMLEEDIAVLQRQIQKVDTVKNTELEFQKKILAQEQKAAEAIGQAAKSEQQAAEARATAAELKNRLQQDSLENTGLQIKLLEDQRKLQGFKLKEKEQASELAAQQIRAFEKDNEIREISDKQRKLEDERIKKDIELQKAEKKLLEVRLDDEKALRNYFSGIVALLGVILLLILVSYYFIRRSNQRLKQQQQEIVKQQNEILRKNSELESQRNEIFEKKEEIEKSYNNMAVISEIGQEITATLELDNISQIVYRHVSALMESDRFGIGVYDDKANKIDYEIYMEKGEPINGISISMNEERFATWVVLNKEPLFMTDIEQEHTRYISNLNSYRRSILSASMICLPLLIEDRVIGIINVQSYAKDAYSQYDLDMLQTMASYVSIAIYNSNVFNSLKSANKIISESNQKITDSIRYAQTIQQAVLPSPEKMEDAFKDYFVIYRPQSIVSGDFYWFSYTKYKVFIAAVDCTGHGVPGAFMSMAGTAYLNQIVNFQGITEPNKILTELSKNIRKALRQELSENKDGMDISVCTVDILQNKLQYSGAKNPLVYIKNKEMFVVKADRFSVGGKHAKAHQEFSLHEIPLEKEQKTCFYIFTDGYEDQFGGLKPTKFMSKNLRKLFLEIHEKPCFEQEKILSRTLEDWTMGHRQIDDILVIGFEI